MNIESREEALRVAQQIIDRASRITELSQELQAKGMQSLECAQSAELEELSIKNASIAADLAHWLLEPTYLGPPLVKPQISLVLVRSDLPPNRLPPSITIEGPHVTPVMLEAAEDLLHTLTTGERQLPKDLYETVARGFGTTREDAKGRILLATYGGRGAPMPSPPPPPEKTSA